MEYLKITAILLVFVLICWSGVKSENLKFKRQMNQFDSIEKRIDETNKSIDSLLKVTESQKNRSDSILKRIKHENK